MTIKKLGLAVTFVLAIGGPAALAGPADAATVPNQFLRTCTWSCSPYVQSNGSYNKDVPSTCYTKHWSGGYQKDRTIWGPCR